MVKHSGSRKRKNDALHLSFIHAYNCMCAVSIYVSGFLHTAGVQFKV
jgi:hypothetical protein